MEIIMKNRLLTNSIYCNIITQVFIDNGATPSILPLSTYNKHLILQKYPKTKNTTPIHTAGGRIESHFWIELPLRLDNQTIQIKVLVFDSECPFDILIGRTSLAHLSAWQLTNFTYSKFPSQ